MSSDSSICVRHERLLELMKPLIGYVTEADASNGNSQVEDEYALAYITGRDGVKHRITFGLLRRIKKEVEQP